MQSRAYYWISIRTCIAWCLVGGISPDGSRWIACLLASERREFTADGKTMSIIGKNLSSPEHTISFTAVHKQVTQPA
jgi:hypothetical protein